MDGKEYIQELIKKFNEDPEDSTILAHEKVILAKVYETEGQKQQLVDEAEELAKEAEEKFKELELKKQQIAHLATRSGAFIDSIIAMKESVKED